MKVLDAIICKAETAESFKKMRQYINQATRAIRRRCDITFVYVTNPKDKTVQIKCPSWRIQLEELEYRIRQYIQAHEGCGWDRTVSEIDI